MMTVLPAMYERPIVHALVGFRLPDGDYITRRDPVTLEQAADFAKFGWEVMIDPWEHDDALFYDRIQRSLIRYWHE